MTDALKLCRVQLKLGDTLGQLAQEYGFADAAEGARWICQLNGVAFNKAAIDSWVMGGGGKRLPFDPKNPYDEKNKIGWAVFDKNIILLPEGGRRACFVEPVTTTTPVLSSSQKKGAALIVGGTLASIAAFLFWPRGD